MKSKLLILLLRQLLMNQEEALVKLTAVNENLAKVRGEVAGLNAKIEELRNMEDLSPELAALVDQLQASVTEIDNLVPDALS